LTVVNAVAAVVVNAVAVTGSSGELGLTPRTANRRGPGRPPGAASAPDRIMRPGVQQSDRVPPVRLKSV
jgi:hypothetical protein